MNEYRFDLSTFTIGDMYELHEASLAQDVKRVLIIANRFTSINLFALPMCEITSVLNGFLSAILGEQSHTDDPVATLIRKALEDEQ